MIRIAALNDSYDGSSDEEDVGPSMEVLEAEATKSYNAAITSLAHNHFQTAEEHFLNVIENPFIEKAALPVNYSPGVPLTQDVQMKYSSFKNLGNLKVKSGDYQDAVEYYLDAVRLDGSEVTLWQRLGAAAIKVKDFELALIAFQEGLIVNPKHWPCLDQLLSVMFILKMYMDCLGLAINTLQRDPGYIKARAFTDKIFEEQPSLMQDVKLYFRDNGILFDKIEYDKSKGDKFINTCESLRPANKVPKPRSPFPLQKIRKPVSSLTWENLTQSLVKTYDILVETTGMDFVAQIDIHDVLKSCNECKIEDKNICCERERFAKEEKNHLNLTEDDEFRFKADNPVKIQSRRQTIELGESEDSFMVNEKRRSTDGEETDKNEERDISDMKEKDLKLNMQDTDGSPKEELKEQDNGSGDDEDKNLDENESEKEKEHVDEDSEKDQQGDEMETEQDDEQEEKMEEDNENDDVEISNDENEEEGNEDEGDNERASETENAVNALKGIMGLHASETLNLTDGDFEYNQDYPHEYFEGNEFGDEGLERDYEVEDEEEADTTMEDDAVEGEDTIEDGVEGEEEAMEGEESAAEGEEDIVEGEEDIVEGEEDIVEGEEEMAEGQEAFGAAVEEKVVEDSKDQDNAVEDGTIEEEENSAESDKEGAMDEEDVADGEEPNRETKQNEQNKTDSHETQDNENVAQEGIEEDEHHKTSQEQKAIETIDKDKNADITSESQNEKEAKQSGKENVENEIKVKESNNDSNEILSEKIKANQTKVVRDEKDPNVIDIASSGEESDKNEKDNDEQSKKKRSNDNENKDKEDDSQKNKRPKRGLERELEALDYWGRKKTKEADAAKRKRKTITNKYLDSGVEEFLSWTDLLRSFIPATLLDDICKPSKTNENLPKAIEQPSENCSTETSTKKTAENLVDVSNANGGTQPQQPPLPDVVTNLVKETKASDSNDRLTPSDASSLAMEVEIVTKGAEETSLNQQKNKVDNIGPKTITSEAFDQVSLLPELPEDSCSPAVVQQKMVKTDVGTKRKLDFSSIDDKGTDSKDFKSKRLDGTGDDKVNEAKAECDANSSSKLNYKKLNEAKEVESFLMRYEVNGGIFHLLQQLIRSLLAKNNKVWPLSSAKMFNEIYPRVRNHVPHGSALSISEDSDRLKESATMALTHWELLASRYSAIKTSTPAKDHGNLKNPFSGSHEHLDSDMLHLGLMLGRADIWVEETPQFHTRFRWLEAQIHLARGNNQKGVQLLELLLSDLDHLAEEGMDYVVEKSRIEMDTTIICNTEIKRQLIHLQRSQNLEQVVDQYTDKQYKEVAELLAATFHDEPPKPRPGVELPSRQTQITILVDSLFRCGQYKEVLEWGAESLAEAIGRYHLTEDDEKEAWTKTITKLVDILNSTIDQDSDIVYEVTQKVVSKLVGQILKILVVQLEQPITAPTLPFETLQPWILMHRLLQSEEQQQQDDDDDDLQSSDLQLQQGLSSENGSFQPRPLALAPKLPKTTLNQANPSTLFIVTAHDELGKHSWCAFNDSELLIYILNVLLKELQRPLAENPRLLLHQALEQTSFCLYSHPSKKAKHKHLRDHGVAQIGLTLDGALQLYAYYRPTTLPDFQTSQIPSITDESTALFKRLLGLIPADKAPESKLVGIENYLSGNSNDVDYPIHVLPNPLIVDIYYSLGDYFFKNKEWPHAQKYYKLDLLVNPDRLDSWAPLGLSMKAQLETQLNSCDVIQDDDKLFTRAKEAVRVLKRALELDEYHTNIWVEMGTLVYQVHSHASRLLKQDLNPDISIETFERLEQIKTDMLDQAESCFNKALKLHEESDEDGLPDERWFYCYMLGKVAEKKNKSPSVILNYYLSSANHLYMIGAKFPRIVNYNNPQYLAVEALELYYRVHSFILKFLLQKEGKEMDDETIKFFENVLDKVASSPFAKYQEKKKGEADLIEIEEMGAESKKKPVDTTQANSDESAIKKSNEVDSQNKKDAEKIDEKAEKSQESDDDIEVVVEKINVSGRKDYQELVNNCLTSLRICLQRFPEHYKSLYRLAHYYYTSKPKKDINKARNYMLGNPMYQKTDYMPVNGLFHQRKIIIQAPKNSNLFHDIWRVPNDEIDRAGSFAAHMYRSVSLTLDILPELKDFFTILEIALSMKNVPDKDKKFLRDNERELLSEHATQVGLQAMKDKFKVLFKGASAVHGNRRLNFLLDVYRAYRSLSKHLPGSEPHLAKMLCEAYSDYKGGKLDGKQSLLKEAEVYCNKNIFLQRQPQSSTAASGPTSMPTSAGASGSAFTGASRRGRPPGVSSPRGAGRGGGRGGYPNVNKQTSGDQLALQQAYKIYENLIHAQALLNSKDLDPSMRQKHMKDLKMYQSQLLRFLHIPSVSQYFQASLQGVGPAGSKLPPPPPGVTPSKPTGSSISNQSKSIARTNTSQSSVSSQNSQNNQGQKKQAQQSNISALAARSQAHGISITSVSTTKTTTTTPGSSPVKQNATLLPVNRGSIGKNSVTPRLKAKVSPTSSSSVPKLPPGTTLSRPVDSTSGNKTETSILSKSTPRPQLAARPVPKLKIPQGARQPTTSPVLPKGLTVVANKESSQPSGKSSSGSSFMDAFQASLGLSNSKGEQQSSVGRGRGSANRGGGRGGASPGGKIAQLDTNQLLALAYGSSMPGSNRGGRGRGSAVTISSARGSMSNATKGGQPRQQMPVNRQQIPNKPLQQTTKRQPQQSQQKPNKPQPTKDESSVEIIDLD